MAGVYNVTISAHREDYVCYEGYETITSTGHFTLALADPTVDGRWFYGFVDDTTAGLARPLVTHDPGYVQSRALGDMFFDQIRANLKNLVDLSVKDCVTRVTAAARATVNDPSFKQLKYMYLTFVIIIERPLGWLVVHLGPEMVFLVQDGSIRELVVPHSGMTQAVASGVAAKDACPLAGVATAAAAPGRAFERHVGHVEATLRGSDWLLIVPGSAAICDLELKQQGTDIQSICDLVERLAEPYAQHNRSWLAVFPEERENVAV